MSGSVFTSASKWFWTDDLARALVDAGHEQSSVLEKWMNAPVAIRGDGDPLIVAESLLTADEARIAAA
jgi:hypothetical protein